MFFDNECLVVLKRWMKKRDQIVPPGGCDALFVSYESGERLERTGVYKAFVKWAIHVGLHDPDSKRGEDRFTPHTCRHWFTTHLRRNEMPREFIMELRGDVTHDAMDIYYHIDRERLRQSYLACIPQLGIA